MNGLRQDSQYRSILLSKSNNLNRLPPTQDLNELDKRIDDFCLETNIGLKNTEAPTTTQVIYMRVQSIQTENKNVYIKNI